LKRKEQIADKLLRGIFVMRQHMNRPTESMMRSVLNPGFFFLLSALSETDSMTMGEISQMMLISKQQTTQVTDRMEEAGYISRIPDEQDRRIVKVMITPEGKESLNQCKEMIREKTIERLEKLPDEDVEELDRALDVLSGIIKKLHQ
jgi:DNA-binding MarR family transcriptional regulator